MLDTNVYVSAFTRGVGVPFGLWRIDREEGYRLLVSPLIVRELNGVLRSKFQWPEEALIRRTKVLARVAEIITPKIRVTHFSGPMEADNRILECALAGEADLIVSGDNDLLRLKSFQEIPILRPADALRILGG
ncbi:MAG: putative toxin-antitoxin system toxin component, PIN family [Acidobacteria bacterium]|nr:putative toxin-antitoxin system toxin component, PIN family [Acidobacteriota bacterium]